MSKLTDIPLVTRDWVPAGDMLFVTNGVNAIARLDGTTKEATYTIKKPKMVIVHTGETYNLKQLRTRAGLTEGKDNA